MTDAELEQVGLYFPEGPFAEERLELLHYLVDHGATLADLVVFREELPGLAAVLALRPTGALTLDELVERSGVDAGTALRIIQAAGFPVPGTDDRVLSPELVEFCRVVPSAVDHFGEDAIFQVVRVMGSTSARLADALVSSFLANVEPTVRNEDPVGLEIARANTLATSLMPRWWPDSMHCSVNIWWRCGVLPLPTATAGSRPGRWESASSTSSTPPGSHWRSPWASWASSSPSSRISPPTWLWPRAVGW